MTKLRSPEPSSAVKVTQPNISPSTNAWNKAAVHSAAENQKPPSERTKATYSVHLIATGGASTAQRTTNDWNSLALARLNKKAG